MTVRNLAERARDVAPTMAQATSRQKNDALWAMAERLETQAEEIVSANTRDLAAAHEAGLDNSVLKRLTFGPEKLAARLRSLRKIAVLPDPVGEVFWEARLENGLLARRVRVPLGVILMIYEARPHVSINAGAFCLKSGNAAILRGGSEAARCNALLGRLWSESLQAVGLPGEAIQMLSGSHADIDELLGCDDCIDLVIPRGGKRLIDAVAASSRIPVIKHFAGVCHVYADDTADPAMAASIAVDSKCLMPEVCNAVETILVSAANQAALVAVCEALRACGVTIRGCERTRERIPDLDSATEADWSTEYLDLTVAVRVVDGVDEAIRHINAYGSHHTDAIVTATAAAAERFQARVDSAVVLVNASTMFCDGETLGMGAEIGISTDKLHARGPMGLRELTSYKFTIGGAGQVMGNPTEPRRS